MISILIHTSTKQLRNVSPNGRAHYMVRAATAKVLREKAYAATMAESAMSRRLGGSVIGPETPIPIRITYIRHATNKAKMDDDNAIASAKACRDGIAEALGVNDSQFRVSLGEPETHEGLRGQVFIRVEVG